MGVSGSRRVTVLVKSLLGIQRRGIASPFKGRDVLTCLEPPLPLTPPPTSYSLEAPFGPGVPWLSGVRTAEG